VALQIEGRSTRAGHIALDGIAYKPRRLLAAPKHRAGVLPPNFLEHGNDRARRAAVQPTFQTGLRNFGPSDGLRPELTLPLDSIHGYNSHEERSGQCAA
jgi:hypothetical protein